MEKKKILMVHNFYQIPGGEDTVFNNEIQMLKDNGNEIYIYTRDNKEIIKMNFLKKFFLPFSSIFNLKTYFDIKKIIKKEKIDIVHCHNTLSLISPSLFYACKKLKVPVFQTIHNFRLLCINAAFYRNDCICEVCVKKSACLGIKNKCYHDSYIQSFIMVLNRLIHKITGIYKYVNFICLTDFNKQKLLSLKDVDPSKIYIKPNYCDIINEKYIPAVNRKKQVVFFGRLDKIKGIDQLIIHWPKNIDYNLIVCGTGPLETWCKKYINDNKIKNISFIGFQSKKNILNLLEESLASILPTKWYEGFPMTIVESFSVGTPVICPDLGNCKSIIKNGINGYKYENLNEIIDLMKKIQNNSTIFNTTFECAKKYSKKNNYKILCEIYNNK